ncbi:MAG: septum formation initiator family protein [Arsenophonus sp.]|nr:MAG: septum formation initiator family protein [Arsenophonus sp.]
MYKFILFFILLGIQYSFWFGKNSFHDYKNLKKDVFFLKKLNKDLEKRNQLLIAEIYDLNTRFDAIEEYSRYELGMIKPEEFFLKILN